MAFGIKSPEFSLVQINNTPLSPVCGKPDTDFCLPMAQIGDISFQFFLKDIPANEGVTYVAVPMITGFEVCSSGSTPLGVSCEDAIALLPWKIVFEICTLPEAISGGYTDVAFSVSWSGDIQQLLVSGKCITFDIHEYRYDGEQCFRTIVGCTNCFEIIPTAGDIFDAPELCHTSTIEYRNNENAFCFLYDIVNTYDTDCEALQNFVNKIRLPLYLRRPQFKSQEKSYRLSSGRFIKLSERIEREYELITGYLPEWVHERLAIALSHDTIAIQNPDIWHTIGGVGIIAVHKSDEYLIEWNEEINYMRAQGSTKIKLNEALCYTNSNCK